MTPERKKILDKAKKLKELADRGIGGEKVNAKYMLENYMKKHNIKMEEIESHKYRKNSAFNNMSDKEFMNEILKDVMVFGFGFLMVSAFGNKQAVINFKDTGLSLLKNKYKDEIDRYKK